MFKIQPATKIHSESIVVLWSKLMAIHKEWDADYFSETEDNINYYKNDIEHAIEDTTQAVFVAIDEEKIVGYITAGLVFFSNSYYNMNSHCEVGDIMVDTEYHNSGVGSLLMEEVKNWAAHKSLKTIQLNVFSKNKSAIDFFTKQNFQPLFSKLEFKI
jgi:ribosomal protein S18 acetylase RimI-like enzyme